MVFAAVKKGQSDIFIYDYISQYKNIFWNIFRYYCIQSNNATEVGCLFWFNPIGIA